MNKIFVKIHLEHLRNKTHVEYHETISHLIEKFNPDTLGIRPQYDVYISLLSDEISVLDIILKSELTDEIYAQDHVRDSVFRGFSDALKSALNHYDEVKRTAAYKIEVIIDHYGNITVLTLDEETAAYDDLIRELKTETNTNLLMTLELIDWIPELSKALISLTKSSYPAIPFTLIRASNWSIIFRNSLLTVVRISFIRIDGR